MCLDTVGYATFKTSETGAVVGKDSKSIRMQNLIQHCRCAVMPIGRGDDSGMFVMVVVMVVIVIVVVLMAVVMMVIMSGGGNDSRW